MDRLKIYLDTSIISHLEQSEKPAEQSDCVGLFDKIKSGEYEAYTSFVTTIEIDDCEETLRLKLHSHLDGIPLTIISETDEINAFAEHIVKAGILTRKSFDDCLHIAAAVISKCDIIVSLNFRHLVKVKTINGVRVVSLENGYTDTVNILPPRALIYELDE